MFKKVDTKLNFVENELDVMKYWEDNKVFNKSIDKNREKEPFVFFDGPPTANGKPHIGHVLSRTIKDIIPRYKTMKGFFVNRIAGWDTHGLPVELEVEKELGFSNKDNILEYGIQPFIEKCKTSVWKYKTEWEQMSKRVGYWCDFDHPYITYTDNYIESVWWAIKELDKKGLLYYGYKIVPFCPRCSTSLSSHEVDQGYKTVKDTSIFVKFKIKNESNSYFLAWTTTPWTLPSNVALCVNPTSEYSKIEVNGEKITLATNLIQSLFNGFEYNIIDKFVGKDLENIEYEPLFTCKTLLKQKAYYITCDDYVTLDSGSGIVHIAPAFGEDDANVGRNYNLPFLQLVNDKGEFTSDSEFEGLNVKKADKLIIENLKNRNLLFKELLFEHNYPHCWRCDTPLIYYATKSWFVKMSDKRDELVKNNNSVNWFPESFKSGRMGTFLENVKDWCITRNRYWGTPLPVWKCECGHYETIGSKAELEKLTKQKAPELHKPYLDNLTIKCSKCGKDMHREPEVIDCWFDSGSMPYAQLHYPFENKEFFEKNFPADFISEGIDQSRGWFYALQALSTALFDRSPYKNVIALGLVNDKNGIKMSKHIGNVVHPNEVLDTEGADAVRWYFASASAPWLGTKFSKDAVEESKRKFMGTLWNTYAFFVLYANIDKFNPLSYNLDECKFSMMDKWLLAELNTLITNVDSLLNNYDIFKASRYLNDFVDNLSNWYVRRCRKRYWASGMEDDKIAAYMTLYHTLVTLSKLIAPFTPFIAEKMYLNLVKSYDDNAPLSVHLTDFPTANDIYNNEKLQEEMNLVIKAVSLGRVARNNANIKNRQPLSNIYIHSADNKIVFTDEMIKNIKEELNIDNVIVLESTSDMICYSLKPQLKTLGPKYGKLINSIRTYLANSNAADILDSIDRNGKFKTNIDGTEIELFEEDLLITTSNKEGVESVTEEDLTVVIDTNLNEELINRGYVFEIISKVQNLRKESGYEVEDRINIYISAEQKMCEIINENINMIKNTLVAKNIEFCNKNCEHNVDIELDNYKIKINIDK